MKLELNQQDLTENQLFLQNMKGENNFFLRISSLNDTFLYLKQKKAWIHRKKVLNSLCSRSCIVPFCVL